jgi:hypothetical protein
MNIDLSKIVSELGDEAIAQCGEPVGLDRDQSVRVARALAAHAGLGREEAVAAAAADTGLTEEVISALLGKLVEAGAEKLVSEGPIGDALGAAKGAASEALGKGAGEMFGKLGGMFGRK